MPDLTGKPTEGLTLLEDDDDSYLTCNRCGVPAIFYNPVTGTLSCFSCAITPRRHGPGYPWQRYASGSRQCLERSPYGGWSCSITYGHSELHEAWGSDLNNPIMAWTPEGQVAYTRDARWILGDHPPWAGHPFTEADRAAGMCGQRRVRYRGDRMTCVCSLEVAHGGWHEAWRPASGYAGRTDPVLAWAPDGQVSWQSETTR